MSQAHEVDRDRTLAAFIAAARPFGIGNSGRWIGVCDPWVVVYELEAAEDDTTEELEPVTDRLATESFPPA